MKIALSSYFFINERLGHEHALMLKAFGIDSVEVWGMPPHLDCLEPDDWKKLTGHMRDEGVTVEAVHGPFYETLAKAGKNRWLSISNTDEKLRLRAVELLKRTAELMGEAGIGLMVAHFGVYGDDDRRLDSILSSMINLEDFLEGTGVRIALENVCSPLSLSNSMKDTLTRFDFQNLGICVDTGHANLNEEPVSAVENAGNFLIHVHASDNTGGEDEHLLPFEGAIPWDKVAEALRAAKFGGCVTLETMCRGDQEEELKKIARTRGELERLFNAL